MAAMQPEPAAVTACRYCLSCTSPAAKTPATLVAVPCDGTHISLLIQVELAGEEVRIGAVADGDEDPITGQVRRNSGHNILESDTGDHVLSEMASTMEFHAKEIFSFFMARSCRIFGGP